MSTPQISLLAGLVHGYVGEKDKAAAEELAARKQSRDSMLTYLGHMVNSPDVPQEHKQWAMQQIPQLAQADITKKLPKGLGDLSTLPPVSIQKPPQQSVQQRPGAAALTLQPPVSPQASSDVGRATNGTVNALGAAPGMPVQQPFGPPAETGNGPQQPNMQQVQGPTTLPAIPAQTPLTIQHPVAPEVLSSGGKPYLLSQADKFKQQQALEDTETQRLQAKYPNKSPEELAYFARHGEFEKPETADLAPGAKMIDKRTGRVIAENKEPKPGSKSGFKIRNGPGGEPLAIENNVTGADMTPQEIEADPEAKALFTAAQQSHGKALVEAEQKQTRQFQQQANMQANAFANALKASDYRAARKEVDGSFKDYNSSLDRMVTMDKNLEAGLKGDQQAMLSLVTNHIGMTLGAQKGARITRAAFDEAVASTPWLQKVGAKFDERGYLSGVTLAPDQMHSMVKLAHEKVETQADSYHRMQEHYRDQLGNRGGGSNNIQKPEGGGGTTGGGVSLPPQALSQLQEGHNTTFANGQIWTLKAGKPEQVK